MVQGVLAAVILVLFTASSQAVSDSKSDHGSADHAGMSTADLPFQPKDPDSIKGRIELEVETGFIQYGPILLFGLLMASGVGLALGEDIFIIPAGFLMQQGIMPFWWTVLAAYFGVVLADSLWVLIVRRFSSRILRFRFFRRLFHPRRILEIKYKFDRWGIWVVIVSRFIPFSRTPVFTAAGLSRMKIWKFTLAESISALPVVAAQLGVGWLLGMGYEMSRKQQNIEKIIAISVLAVGVIVALWIWRRRKRKKIRPPRAPIAWLRQAVGGPVRPRAASSK